MSHIQPIKPAKDTIAFIVGMVAKQHNLNAWEVVGPSREHHLIPARQQAQFIAFDRGYSISEIAAAFKRDRSTVLYSIRQVSKRTEITPRCYPWAAWSFKSVRGAV